METVYFRKEDYAGVWRRLAIRAAVLFCYFVLLKRSKLRTLMVGPLNYIFGYHYLFRELEP